MTRWLGAGGLLVDVEVPVNGAYEYDIRGEVVEKDRHGGIG